MSGYEDINTNSTELFVDVVDSLNLTQGELSFPQTMNKVNKITQFLKTQEDPRYILGKVRRNNTKEISNIDFMYGLVDLMWEKADIERVVEKEKLTAKELTEHKSRLKRIKDELKYYG